MFAITVAEKNGLVTAHDIDPNFISQISTMATYQAPESATSNSEQWQPNLTQFPTSNVICVNCYRIVRTITTYTPGPKACCLGTLSFLFG